MLIVLDANALFGDPRMLREPASSVLELLSPAGATLVFSPVVLGELKRQHVDEVQQLALEIQTRLRRLGRHAAVSVDEMSTQVAGFTQQAEKRWDDRVDEILSHPRVRLDQWPEVDAERMVQRELARRRLFVDEVPGTIGHRDTVIWLGVVALATRSPGAQIVLVTADKGFLEGKRLHKDLLEDLAAAGVDAAAVRHLNSLAALKALLEQHVKQTEKLGWRRASIAELIYDTLHSLDRGEFVPTWNPRDGGYEEPRFDVGLSRAVDDWSIEYIEGPTSLEVEHAPLGVDSLACSFIAELRFSGFMEKSEWYTDDHEGIELWDANWNDYYVAVEAQRTLRFELTLWIDDEAEDVGVDEIDSVTVQFDIGH